MKNFKIPKTKWKSFPIDSAKFILEEGKDYLDYTLKESDKITNRAYSLIILLSTILAAIVGYTFTKITTDSISSVIVMNLYFSFAISGFILFLATLVFPRSIMQKGRIPSKLAQEKFLTNSKLTSEEIYLSYVIREIENTQDKINYNLNKNRQRRIKLEVSLYFITVLFPIYLSIAFYIFS
ncbi:hypothetical protein [Psychroserpens sp. SPM9]|uniref:hypothetical protein n=1 Tax=Psychroserpens sp. SPM9 TaxID=2975598 RepID=UPI0021A2D128|nr:hypothetical protein [Psychroserpens sp. SPM9]MDG5490587.1 hypothetical protein [Psychroserpens sp. SPM9]